MAPTLIYPLSLHDALPIWIPDVVENDQAVLLVQPCGELDRSIVDVDERRPLAGERRIQLGQLILQLGSSSPHGWTDRKSTRLNSSHPSISYAVFCLKKKNQ